MMSARLEARAMRRVAVLGLTFALVLSGCLGGIGAQSPGSPPGSSASDPLPSPPEQLNESSAEAFALEYERVRLTNRLREQYGNDSFGVGCCTASKSATTVTERSGTYYVRVRYPYYYETGSAETDGATHATYAVSEEAVKRVDLRERVIPVDDPYSASNHTENAAPPSVYLVNAADTGRDVSVTLTHLGEGETAFDREVALDANASVEVSQVALRKGEYRLTVATDGGSTEHRFVIDDTGSGTILVLFTGDATVARQVSESGAESADG